MKDVTLIFDVTNRSPSKDRAIKIAERYEIHKEKNKIRVVFQKNCADLVTLAELCKQWKSSELFIDNQEYGFPEILKILKCNSKGYCEGFCYKGTGSLHFGLKEEIENATKGIYDDFSDPESVKKELSQINGIKIENDGSYRVDKNELKKNLLIDYNLPLRLCEKIDREQMIKSIDQLPDSFKISDDVIEIESEFEGPSDYQIAEFTAQAEIMGPIIAKHIAREIDKVFIANLGPEKDAKSCAKKGDYLFELARYDESLDCFEKALTFESRNPDALFGKTLVLFYLERFPEAVAPITAYLDLDPMNPRAWKLRGGVLEKNKRYDESMKDFKKSLHLFTQELKENADHEDIKDDIEFVTEKIAELSEIK